jgi:hypothetical protein
MARARGKKRTAAEAAATDSSKPDAAAGDSTKTEPAAAEGRGRRPKAPPKPKAETEYFPEKRNLVSAAPRRTNLSGLRRGPVC